MAVSAKITRLRRIELRTSSAGVDDELYKKSNDAKENMTVNQILEKECALCSRAQMYENKARKEACIAP
jgi:hypothetical protein